MKLAINLINLTKNFGRLKAVDNLNLQIEAGKIFGFLGPNGAGKTTTIKMILGLLKPTSGKVEIFGTNNSNTSIRARIGYLPENPSIHNFLTAEEFLDFHGKLYEIPTSIRNERIDKNLKLVELNNDRKRKLREFSKGMLQRVVMAQALLNEPDLLLLDEPTSGLDPIGRKEFRDLILSLKKQGKTIFLNSHLLSEIEMTCDSVGILDKGKLLKIGTVDELTLKQDFIEVRISDEKIQQGKTNELLISELKKVAEDVKIDGDKLVLQGNTEKLIMEVPAIIVKCGAKLISINPRKETLEDIFYKIVKDTNKQ